jgi:hypothetical protein
LGHWQASFWFGWAFWELLLRIDAGCNNHEDGDVPYERWVETTTFGAEPSYSCRSEAQRANALQAIRKLRQTIANYRKNWVMRDRLTVTTRPQRMPSAAINV